MPYGRYIQPQGLLTIVTESQADYIGNTIVFISTAAARASLLCLYNRIFHVDPVFQIGVAVLAVANALTIVGTILTLVFYCKPVEASWNLSVPERCLSNFSLVVGTSVPDSILDLAVLGLVLLALRRLQMPLRHKIAVGVMVALGGLYVSRMAAPDKSNAARVSVLGFLRVSMTYEPEYGQ